MSRTAHINRIGTAVPGHDVHAAFIRWAERRLSEPRARALFARMAARSGIETAGPASARALRRLAVDPRRLLPRRPADHRRAHGHLCAALRGWRWRRSAISTAAAPRPASATSSSPAAPASSLRHRPDHRPELGLGGHVERTLVGFMGCYAAVRRSGSPPYRPLRARSAGAGGDGRALQPPSPI